MNTVLLYSVSIMYIYKCSVCARCVDSELLLLQVVLHPTPNSPKQSELHKMAVSKGCPDSDLKIKLAIRMDKPQNMKHCG